MARSERSKLVIRLLCSLGCLLISLTLTDSAQSPGRSASQSQFTIEAVQRLYNRVLDSTIEDARLRRQHLNASEAIDQQYFDNLDTITGNEDYYSTAYYIFAWLNSQLMAHQTPDKLLEEILPGEKVLIRNFFATVKIHLVKYLQVSRQTRPEFIANVTRLAGETEDVLIESYLRFPNNLESQLPELQLMDYTKLAKSIIEGIATGVWSG